MTKGNLGRCVILFSGGLNSIYTALKVIHEGFTPFLLFVDYGQRCYAAEKHAAMKCAKLIGIEPHFISEANVSSFFGNSEGNHHRFISLGNNVTEEGKNAVMILRAAMTAAQINASAIAIGNILYYEYENTSNYLIENMTRLHFAISSGFVNQTSLLIPCAKKKKEEIISYLKVAVGDEFHQLLRESWSCQNAGIHPCGNCSSCVARNRALKNVEFETRLTESI